MGIAMQIPFEKGAAMGNIAVTVGDATISIPDFYQVVESMPDDPPASVPVMTQTSMGTDFALFYPMPSEYAMPYEGVQDVIDDIHASLAENQGLVQVANGRTDHSRSFIFSIVKTRVGEHGLQYVLTLDVDADGYAIRVQGFFDEGPTTGIRAAATYSMLREQGMVAADMGNWAADPYDPAIQHGYLANRGESQEFDELFPEHPLSLARSLVAHVVTSL